MDNAPPLSSHQIDLVIKSCRYFLSAVDSRNSEERAAAAVLLAATMSMHSFIYPFDWIDDYRERPAFFNDRDKLSGMSRSDLRKVFTVHFRMDRFVAGHLEELCKNGYLAAAVSRLLEVSAA